MTTMRYGLARHVNGICLNDLEYVLKPTGNLYTFPNKDEAKAFAFRNGFKQEDFDNSCIFVVSVDMDGNTKIL